MLNKNQKKQIERVCGKNWEESDIPSFWRHFDSWLWGNKKENPFTSYLRERLADNPKVEPPDAPEYGDKEWKEDHDWMDEMEKRSCGL
jgi:hypothetical protein